MLQSVIVLCQNEQKSYNFCIESACKILHINKVNLNHPDLMVITGLSSIGIEQVKTAIEKMKRYPYQTDHIVAIIHPGDLLTIEAQNALLKLIEEPPKYVRIFITSTHHSHLLPTIRSRCKIHYINERKSYKDSSKIDLSQLIKDPISQRLLYLDKIVYKKIGENVQIKEILDNLLLTVSPKTNPRLFKRVIRAKEMALKNVTNRHVLDYIALINCYN